MSSTVFFLTFPLFPLCPGAEKFFLITASLKLKSFFLQIAHLNYSTSYICSVGFGNPNAFLV